MKKTANKILSTKNINLTFRIVAGQAKPNVKAIASGLAPLKVKLVDFCNQVNSDPEILNYKGKIVQVSVSVAKDGSFKYQCKGRPVSHLLKEAAGIEKASKIPGRENCGSITEMQLRSIAEAKSEFLTASDIEKQISIIKGAAKSIGLDVVN